MRVGRRWIVAAACLGLLAIGGCAKDDGGDDAGHDDENAPPVVYEYDVPLKATSPWPMFRRTGGNTGRSPIVPVANGLAPWRFQTGKGLFHAPAIDEDGTVYMGSGDTFLYAIHADGTEKWRFATGEVNDSSALIEADGTIVFPSGDGFVYALNPDGTEKWRLAALGDLGYITWWEGHVAMGRDGTLLAGNDDRRLYAIDPGGWVKWTSEAGDQVWSCPATTPDGTIFFGGNDLMVRAVSPAGEPRWKRITLGPVASSPAITDDGRLAVVGSFDGYVHAYDTATGRPAWKFAARDHIYASPAIAADGTIRVGSGDGTMYALSPEGALLWAFDTLDPIRSSAAVDGEGNAYFGGADGKVYALRADGARLWSYDAAMSERNDLNGSPAISPDGIVIGGEEGAVIFLPFGYCENSGDPRCSLDPGEDIPADGAFLYTYTPAGASLPAIATPPAPMDALTFRLVVREDGDTVAARIDADALFVSVAPSFPFHVAAAASGQFFSVVPDAPLVPGAPYTVSISGQYRTGGTRIGNKVTGGEFAGTFAKAFPLSVAAATGRGVPLERTGDRVTVLRLRRIAAPQPPMLTTFNQIGFDSYNYFLATVEADPATGRLVLLAAEGTPGLDPRLKPDTISVFPLNGRALDAFFTLQGGGMVIDVSGVSIPLDVFRFSGALAEDGSTDSLSVFAEATCGDIEFFGFALDLLGLCHPETDRLVVNGTAMLVMSDGPEGVRPEGVTVTALEYQPTGGMRGGGTIDAAFAGGGVAAERLATILAIDAAAGEALELGYGEGMEKIVGGGGELAGARLHLPPGFDPTGKRVVVLVDLFPLYEETW